MLLRLAITARSPLAFARSKPGTQFRASLPYVPGGALFGALGRLLLEEDQRGEAGRALLRAARCWNAYPAWTDDAWARPLPATARRPRGGGPLRDTLVDLVCWEQLEPAAFLPNGAELAATSGFYTLAESGADPSGRAVLGLRRVGQRVLTRVAINRRRGTAEDGRLYSPLVLSEYTHEKRGATDRPTRFLGAAWLPADLADPAALIARVDALGGRQSSGLGAVSVEATPQPDSDAAGVGARVVALTRRFQERASLFQGLTPRTTWSIAERSLFTINLLADAVLFEEGWLPTNLLSPAALHELTGINARLVRAVAAPVEVSGWNVFWQRPKPAVLGTAMGGVYLFEADEPLSDADCAALAALERDGIGERRQEGYGQVRICDELHWAAFDEEMPYDHP